MDNIKQRAPAHRLIGSVVYDGLIVLGLLMIAGSIVVPINYSITGNESIQNNPFFQVYLLVVILSYYLYFWLKSGQTVGMKAWRLKLVTEQSSKLTYKQLLLRMLVAIPAYLLVGVGVFWQYWSKSGLNWQDQASGTAIEYSPKKKSAL